MSRPLFDTCDSQIILSLFNQTPAAEKLTFFESLDSLS